jgi:hypothetical protein
MIHHLSISAHNPRRVAEVLAEVFGGKAIPFSPHHGSYMAVSGKENGTTIEVYPQGTELIPGTGEQHVQFQENTQPSNFYATHAAISVPTSQEEIEQIASREGWRVLPCSRRNFEVIEFWVENCLMLELLTPEMASDYLQFTQRRNLEEFFASPV